MEEIHNKIFCQYHPVKQDMEVVCKCDRMTSRYVAMTDVWEWELSQCRYEQPGHGEFDCHQYSLDSPQPSLLWSAWWSVTRLWFQRAIHIPHSNDVENFNYSILPFIFSHNDCHYHMVSVLSHMYVYKFSPYSCLP